MTPDPEPQPPSRAAPRRGEPACYELRVDGHLDERWSAWFGGLRVTHDDDGTTSLTGPVADQAELHGLLAKVRDLGVTLISVAVVVPDDAMSLPHQAAPGRS